MQRQAYSHLGPGDPDFKTLENVAYRAFRKSGLSTEDARDEALSFAYTAAVVLDNRVEEVAR